MQPLKSCRGSSAQFPLHILGVCYHPMDSAFGSHLDQLIHHLKTEVLQHYERDLAAYKGKKLESETLSAKPHILGLQRKAADGPDFSRNRKFLLNRRSAPDSDSDEELFEPRSSTMSTVQPRFASKTAMSEDSDVSEQTADSLELKTPKPGSRVPKFPKPEGLHPFSPHTPPEMLEPQVFPVSKALALPDDAVALPHQPDNADDPQQPDVENEKEEKDGSSASESRSSASFSSTSTPNDEMPKVMPNRCRDKRPSNASFSEFFKRQQTVTDLYLLLQDEDSSKAAWLYAKFMNYFVTLAIIFTVWQANAQPVVPRFVEGGIQLGVEGLMLLELLAHFFSTRSGERSAFLKNP